MKSVLDLVLNIFSKEGAPELRFKMSRVRRRREKQPKDTACIKALGRKHDKKEERTGPVWTITESEGKLDMT